MRVAYYPGCSLQSVAKEYDSSTRAVSKALGIELIEIPDWNCCGASAAHASSEYLATALSARNLCLAEEMKLNVTSPCAACYQSLAHANWKLTRDQDLLAKINQAVEQPYQGGVKVLSIIDVFNEIGVDKIQSRVLQPLQGLRVAVYYGCLLVRPPQVVSIDDSENPQLLDNLIKATGAETVEWSHKVECCGGSLSVTNEEVSLKMVKDILSSAAAAGALCIVDACPQCHLNLDMRQKKINKLYNTNFNIPIIYFTQLLGLAMGIQAKELNMKTHFVNTDPVTSLVG
ncbi:CoB--CoM heterodisulfide reductase iron-sulfur subunit B family protein [Desulforamulus aquiferis]|uniref:CoB--CoM heterodisulfide reductase iron-sulfur subunit B family protein n=1 Tax=Desulforamulus aquiferis TaxID=1397668 RepID=A0AAW7ZFK0_9FIRM|nr:CoB--CoM heterodisulfide reductase iron-sulfur subunit B family protein [Desulforamulus aquiferis]MDO7788142.1 CoB--CoM heterodisulfide reductase iron-sulfur subunit B family protein [Desulforamulus aquiferis]